MAERNVKTLQDYLNNQNNSNIIPDLMKDYYDDDGDYSETRVHHVSAQELAYPAIKFTVAYAAKKYVKLYWDKIETIYDKYKPIIDKSINEKKQELLQYSFPRCNATDIDKILVVSVMLEDIFNAESEKDDEKLQLPVFTEDFINVLFPNRNYNIYETKRLLEKLAHLEGLIVTENKARSGEHVFRECQPLDIEEIFDIYNSSLQMMFQNSDHCKDFESLIGSNLRYDSYIQCAKILHIGLSYGPILSELSVILKDHKNYHREYTKLGNKIAKCRTLTDVISIIREDYYLSDDGAVCMPFVPSEMLNLYIALGQDINLTITKKEAELVSSLFELHVAAQGYYDDIENQDIVPIILFAIVCSALSRANKEIVALQRNNTNAFSIDKTESKLEKANEKDTKINELEEKISKLTQENSSKQNAIAKRDNKISALETDNNDLKKEIKELKALMESMGAELASLKPDANEEECEEEVSEQMLQSVDLTNEEISKNIEEYLSNHSVTFVGGNENLMSKVTHKYPDITYITDKNLSTMSNKSVTYADIVMMKTDCLSHSLFYKVQNLCKNSNKHHYYVPRLTNFNELERAIWAIIEQDIKQKEEISHDL